jgi:hypothetical protein
MTLHPKLVGIPHIYYINLDNELTRREYMESQFKNLGIKNYTRVNASKYSRDDFDSWRNIIHCDSIFPKCRIRSLAVSLSHLETLKEWVENTEEEHIILMEDDTDLSFVEYWHFDWEYLMNNIPYDWDAIQLMYNSYLRIYCFLHPKKGITWNGPILINRNYAKKLISLFYFNGKYNFMIKTNRMDLPGGPKRIRVNSSGLVYVKSRFAIVDVDDFLGFSGKVYQLPLFSQNPELDDPPRLHHLKSRKACVIWWTKMRDKFTLDDFFTYGKTYDGEMILELNKRKENKKSGKV